MLHEPSLRRAVALPCLAFSPFARDSKSFCAWQLSAHSLYIQCIVSQVKAYTAFALMCAVETFVLSSGLKIYAF